MKKLLLFIILLFSELCFSVDFPEAKFNSVNTYNSGANYTPNITPVGATQVYSNTTTTDIYKPRKSVGREDGNDTGDPYATPIGDAPFMTIFLFATFYALCKRKP